MAAAALLLLMLLLLLLLLLLWGIACKRAIAGGDGAGGVTARGSRRDDGTWEYIEKIKRNKKSFSYFQKQIEWLAGQPLYTKKQPCKKIVSLNLEYLAIFFA